MSVLYCDGAKNKNTKDEAWGSVVDEDGNDMIRSEYSELLDLKKVYLPKGERTIIIAKFNDVKTQQINGAELLALLFALRIAVKNTLINKIYCDSAVAISWSLKGPQKKTKEKMDIIKLKFIEESILLRKQFESRGGIIEKIKGKDNKADLGWHK